MTTEYPTPEQRVRDYLEAIAFAHGTDGGILIAEELDTALDTSDLRDVLNELEEHRQILIQIDELLDGYEGAALLERHIREIMGNHTQKETR